MRKNKYVVTAEQFALLREKLQRRDANERFDANNIEAAHAVMVLGEPVATAASANGCSRQNLYRVIRDLQAIAHDAEPPSRTLQRKRASHAKTPTDWIRLVVTVPPELARTVQDIERNARADLERAIDAGESASRPDKGQ
jgi:hypothetical protein